MADVKLARDRKGQEMGRWNSRAAGDERPSPQAIAQLAYELYLKRGGIHGDDWSDWFHAEALLTQGGARAGRRL